MKMNDTVARIVEIMFQDVELNEETVAIRDEVMNNCQERYMDLVTSGISEDEAIAAVIESLKGMDEVLAPYKKKVQNHHEQDPNEKELDSVQHVSFSAEMVQKIDVALVSEDVNIEAADDDHYHVIWNTDDTPCIKVEQQKNVLCIIREARDESKAKKEPYEIDMNDMANFVKTDDGKIEINMDGIGQAIKSLGDKIKLHFADGMRMGFRSTSGVVTIQVPEKASPWVKVRTTSGNIDVQDVTLADLNVTSTSGDISIDLNDGQYLQQQMEVHTTSGDIEVSVFADRASIASTSGDVDVEGRYNKLSIATISGDIDVRAEVVNMNFSAISGDVDLSFDSDEIRKVNGSTISGDIDIDLPEGLGEMEIETKSRSGNVINRYVTNGVGLTVSGGVSSMSGDITIC